MDCVGQSSSSAALVAVSLKARHGFASILLFQVDCVVVDYNMVVGTTHNTIIYHTYIVISIYLTVSVTVPLKITVTLSWYLGATLQKTHLLY